MWFTEKSVLMEEEKIVQTTWEELPNESCLADTNLRTKVKCKDTVTLEPGRKLKCPIEIRRMLRRKIQNYTKLQIFG